MAKLGSMSLEDLYERKITGSVEKAILEKEDFSKKAVNWCDKVCKLKCKNPPLTLFPTEVVDVLVIQDYNAFDEPMFKKKGAVLEKKHEDLVSHFVKQGLRNKEGKPYTYAITNLLKCQLTQADINRGKAPTDTIIMKCRPYVLKEIELRKPKVIISLSTSVTKVLGLKKSNSRDSGDICEHKGVPVVLTLHPRILLMLRQNSSGSFWGPDFYAEILRDFQKAAKLIRGELSVPNLPKAIEKAKKNIFIARSIKDVIRFCGVLIEVASRGKVLSFDTETNSLDPFDPNSKVICIQFGFRNDNDEFEAYVMPMNHRDNNWYDHVEALKFIRVLLEDEKIRKIGHNIKFDCLFMSETYGVYVVGILYDTMLLLHSLNSGMQGMYGLKKAVGDFLADSELAGYEDMLPKLIKRKKETEDGIDDGQSEGEDQKEGSDEAEI